MTESGRGPGEQSLTPSKSKRKKLMVLLGDRLHDETDDCFHPDVS